MAVIGLLFGLSQRVTRRAYLGWGFSLAAVKFAADTAIVYACTGKTWSPLGYLLPSLILRQEATGHAPPVMYILLALAALPFLWIGLTMSVRRAADAGVSPWWGLGFLVPVANYVTIACLAGLSSKVDAKWIPPVVSPYRRPPSTNSSEQEEVLPPGMRAAFLGILASVVIGMAMMWLCVYGLSTYGSALFFATPFAMGAISSAIYNARHTRALGGTIGTALLSVAIAGTICLLFAVEGVLCLAMAFPIAAGLSIVGAIIAWAIVSQTRQKSPLAMMLVLPAFAAGEAKLQQPTLRDVVTTIEIDAPPEQVWPHVIGFSELAPPPEWFFKLGISYPMRAKIHGTGVGAVRHCEFSTGPFVEPITVWEPPHRLAFDVTSQPPSMTEWSPYESVKAPHLEGYMVSKGGEFRLIELPNHRTRVEGTTHYTLAIYPEVYWASYAERLLHAIHGRVLAHIKKEVETGVAPSSNLLE